MVSLTRVWCSSNGVRFGVYHRTNIDANVVPFARWTKMFDASIFMKYSHSSSSWLPRSKSKERKTGQVVERQVAQRKTSCLAPCFIGLELPSLWMSPVIRFHSSLLSPVTNLMIQTVGLLLCNMPWLTSFGNY